MSLVLFDELEVRVQWVGILRVTSVTNSKRCPRRSLVCVNQTCAGVKLNKFNTVTTYCSGELMIGELNNTCHLSSNKRRLFRVMYEFNSTWLFFLYQKNRFLFNLNMRKNFYLVGTFMYQSFSQCLTGFLNFMSHYILAIHLDFIKTIKLIDA